jgi:3-phytase
MKKNIIWSMLLLAGCQPKDFPSATLIVPATNIITADAETPPVPSRKGKDAADDPAIWYNAADPEKSAVIGTVKRYGLEVYNLNGQKLHSYKVGNPNNVDVRNGFRLKNGDFVDLAVCSDRSTNEILVFKINPADASLELLSGGRIKTSLAEVYGICLYKSYPSGDLYVFVNGKDGSVQQYHLFATDQNGIGGKLVRQFNLNRRYGCR